MSAEHTAETAQIATPDYQTIWCELIDSTTGHYVSGWGAIIKGADVAQEALAAALRDYHSRDTFRVVSEVQHLHYVPRVKWCSRHDGFGCDSEGDWHGHWFGVKHNPASKGCCYTLALPVFDVSTPPGQPS